ncbi:cobalamin biosynthesis protein CobD [Siculibacillus lacustris]|uniref:Cobalamin biosynthesis protein CobD n=1 Tax=Siculibacillus lacustris TaxID=1549641 RepID=A0A4Q9VL20_9HYPH|nr:adenosylcobinamide-phosphate synthase CbiB [Siculibacillus lacustris]TBW35237.1 cobalamin biosynthesis protein CobD [Siculibacillus lacustris]
MSLALSPSSTPTLALIALAIEAAVGYPAPLYAAIGHPVTWIGAVIAALDRRLNHDVDSFARRKAAGVLALIAVLALTGGVALAIVLVLRAALPGAAALVAVAVVAASLPAQRSLDVHVRAVADGLDAGLDAGRRAVGMIVGRNTGVLDGAGVARAAIESLAENFSDGIVAPLFWTAVAGLPGGALYKAANTADSMIGHRTPRHEAFGWAAARFDDLVNLPASRLAALWLMAAALVVPGASAAGAWRAIRRDAGGHTSPNAGWPESAMAGALGFALAGPRVYGESLLDAAVMGDGRRDLGAADIRRALTLYRVALGIQAAVLAVVAVAIG